MTEQDLTERLKFIIASRADGIPTDALISICSSRWSVPENDVEFWLSAIGSYHFRDAMKGTGTHMNYDENFMTVFRALDQLYNRKRKSVAARIWSAMTGK